MSDEISCPGDDNVNKISRRDVIRAGAAAFAAGAFMGLNSKKAAAALPPATPFKFTPFTQPLIVPPVIKPVSTGTPPTGFVPGQVFHGIAPEWFGPQGDFDRKNFELFPPSFYQVEMNEFLAEIIPGVKTPVWGWNGLVPGPTFKSRMGEPHVLRLTNNCKTERSRHLHGGHNPAHPDGHPNFLVLPGKARDYYYTNSVPREGNGKTGPLDTNESTSTMWYHDHALDITSKNVMFGCPGFHLNYDNLELGLIKTNVLPADAYDIPLAFHDKRFNSDGTIFFDPLNHDGHLGDVFCVNGKAQPVLTVERRKYRFRFLNAHNARWVELRLSNGQSMIRLGKDSWLYPNAIDAKTVLLGMANRADVVIDFTNAPNSLYLENILVQTDGRGPSGTLTNRTTQIPGTPYLKFNVVGPIQTNSASVAVGTALRPNSPILPSEIKRTRIFNFERANGAWQINGQFFDPNRADATPTIGDAERWILRNSAGGWWHPIHIHLESHQYVSVNGQAPPIEDRFKHDTAMLGANTEIELFMKFRTFKGPFVFHCHNLDHEDMRMMKQFDPRTVDTPSPQPVQQFFP